MRTNFFRYQSKFWKRKKLRERAAGCS